MDLENKMLPRTVKYAEHPFKELDNFVKRSKGSKPTKSQVIKTYQIHTKNKRSQKNLYGYSVWDILTSKALHTFYDYVDSFKMTLQKALDDINNHFEQVIKKDFMEGGQRHF